MKTSAVTVALLAACCSACSNVSKLRQVLPTADATGRSVAAVEIDSSPTPAWIYVENRFVGSTPLVHEFHYDSGVREMEVIAEPLPGNSAQIRQRRSFPLPPLPTRVHFFMNNPVPLNNYE